MRHLFQKMSFCSFLVVAASTALQAAPISSCNSDDSVCNVYEGQFVTFPLGYLGVAGDVIIQSPFGTAVAVFRIFNDFVDTGGGTGLGVDGFLYAADLHDLPNPSTYSLNAATILRGTTGIPGFYETDYTNGQGTVYQLFTTSPEPSGFGLLLTACFVAVFLRVKIGKCKPPCCF